MRNLGYSIFELAEIQLQREGIKNYTISDIIDYAIKIRHYLDLQEEKNLFKKLS